jgi:glycerol-3-phosphate acyltransferase PlsX
MTRALTVALDAMGGDHAPRAVIEGAAQVLSCLKQVNFIFFGDREQIIPVLSRYPKLMACSEVRHTTESVANEDKPTSVLRNGQKTSMWQAIESVAAGQADCIVSGGNTGALMVLARKHLKMLPGIDRPAIAAPMPTVTGQTVVLDLGANIDCTPTHLEQFALMGAVYAKAVMGITKPKIGIINVGEEDQKGTDLVRKTAALLRESQLPGEFIGFIEGNDIGRGAVDVAVTDGFTGNVLLKTAEGTAHFIKQTIKNFTQDSLWGKLIVWLSLPMLLRLRHRMDPRLFNGAMFVGLGGVCVKSHGSMDEKGFANAIKIAANLVVNRFNDQVAADLKGLADKAVTEEVAA